MIQCMKNFVGEGSMGAPALRIIGDNREQSASFSLFLSFNEDHCRSAMSTRIHLVLGRLFPASVSRSLAKDARRDTRSPVLCAPVKVTVFDVSLPLNGNPCSFIAVSFHPTSTHSLRLRRSKRKLSNLSSRFWFLFLGLEETSTIIFSRIYVYYTRWISFIHQFFRINLSISLRCSTERLKLMIKSRTIIREISFPFFKKNIEKKILQTVVPPCLRPNIFRVEKYITTRTKCKLPHGVEALDFRGFRFFDGGITP